MGLTTTSLLQAMQKHRLVFLLQFKVVIYKSYMETPSEKEETLAAIHTHDYNILGHNPCGGIYVLIG